MYLLIMYNNVTKTQPTFIKLRLTRRRSIFQSTTAVNSAVTQSNVIRKRNPRVHKKKLYKLQIVLTNCYISSAAPLDRATQFYQDGFDDNDRPCY